jgi:hypothetical protein
MRLFSFVLKKSISDIVVMEFSQICYSSCHFVIEMPLSQEDSARAIALVHVGFSIREAANSLSFARSSVHKPYFVFVRLEGTPEDLDQDVEEVQALVIIDTLRCLV